MKLRSVEIKKLSNVNTINGVPVFYCEVSRIDQAVDEFFEKAGTDFVWATPGTDNHSANFYGDEHIIKLSPDDVFNCIVTATENWYPDLSFEDETGDAIESVLSDLQYDMPDE